MLATFLFLKKYVNFSTKKDTVLLYFLFTKYFIVFKKFLIPFQDKELALSFCKIQIFSLDLLNCGLRWISVLQVMYKTKN